MSDKRTCLVCGRTFDGYGLRLWCSVGCETNSFEIASLESRLQAMTERAEKAEEQADEFKWGRNQAEKDYRTAVAATQEAHRTCNRLREALARLVRRCEKDGICTPPCNCPYCRDYKKARAAIGEEKP